MQCRSTKENSRYREGITQRDHTIAAYDSFRGRPGGRRIRTGESGSEMTATAVRKGMVGWSSGGSSGRLRRNFVIFCFTSRGYMRRRRTGSSRAHRSVSKRWYTAGTWVAVTICASGMASWIRRIACTKLMRSGSIACAHAASWMTVRTK